VGSGHDHTDVKVILSNETGNAGGGENSGGGHGGASVGKARGDDGGNVRAGFASVRAYKRVGRRMIAMKIFGDGTAERKKSGVVERGSSGDAADAVGAKKLSRHG